MTIVLSETAERVAADVPPYLMEDESVRRLFQAQANEIDRADATLAGIRAGLMPATAHDQYKGLSMLEAQMRLPVAPTGVSEDSRRATLNAYLRARRAGTGAAWVALMTLALGTTPWTYHEGPDDYTVTVKIPYAPGSFTAGQVVRFARAITPAHIDIIASYGEGFLIGISEIGVEPL